MEDLGAEAGDGDAHTLRNHCSLQSPGQVVVVEAHGPNLQDILDSHVP